MMKRLSFPEKLTEIYLSALFFFLPLYVHNAYFDITEAKTLCFTLLTTVYVLLMPFGELHTSRERRRKPALMGFLLYAALGILSSLIFMGSTSLLAASNRYQGVLVLALYALSFFFCSRNASFSLPARWAALTAMALVSLCALCQSFGMDLLGFWEGLRSIDRGRYLSTVGNVNFLAAYYALLLPLCGGLCCRRQELLPLFALGCCAVLCGSDSGILGLGAGMLFLYGLESGDEKSHRSFGLLSAVAGLSFFLYGLALRSFGVLGLSALGELLSSPYVSLPLSGAGVLLWRRGRASGHPWLLPVLFSAAAVSTLALCNLFPTLVPRSLRNLLVFSPQWGSDRGKIWLHGWELFRSFSPLQKLIGGGSGCLAAFDRSHRLFADAVVDCAHNEYLQILLTGGMAGLGSYLFALFSALREGAKKQPALAAAVFGCAIQAGVNIAQCTTTPLLLALLALL